MMAEKFPDIIEENVIWLDYTFPTQFFKIRFIFALVSLKRQFIFHPTVLNSTNLLVNLILVTTSLTEMSILDKGKDLHFSVDPI